MSIFRIFYYNKLLSAYSKYYHARIYIYIRISNPTPLPQKFISEMTRKNMIKELLSRRSNDWRVKREKEIGFDREEMKYLIETIDILVNDIIVNKKFVPPTNPYPYMKISGKTMLLKSQIAFLLANDRPVIYTNLGDPIKSGFINDIFGGLDKHILKILTSDLVLFERYTNDDIGLVIEAEDYSDYLFHNKNLEFEIIGFLFSLIKNSAGFVYEDEEDFGHKWFIYYLTINVHYRSMNLNDFYKKMSKLLLIKSLFNSILEKLVIDKPDFKIPIIFIDNFYEANTEKVKLFKSVVRCFGLPVVITSQESKTKPK